MPDALLVEKAVILAKIEATYGVDPVPAATDAIVTGLPSITINGEKIDRMATGASLSSWAHRIGIKSIEITFPMEVRGLGTAYGAAALPEISALLRACGLGETVDATPASENVVYQPVSVAMESCTIYVYEDGILYKILGCRGDVEFVAETGKTCIANFTMQGLYLKPVDTALIAPTYDDIDVLPPVIFSAGLSVGGDTPIAAKAMFKVGNSLVKRMDVNNAQGYREIIINDRASEGSIDPEMELLATKDFFQLWEDGTPQALLMQVGSVQYNKFDFSAPKSILNEVGLADRDKIRTMEIPLSLSRNTGDDELVITFD